MADFTQEQVDALVLEKIKEAKVGLFTQDDLNKEITKETDRRVETGIQKGLETFKTKWENEFSEKAKLTAEELAKKEVDEQLKTVGLKEQEINKRANKLDAKDMLSEADIPKAYYTKFIDMLVSDDVELTKANVTNFIEMFKQTKVEIETQIKADNTKVTPPKTGGGDKSTTKEQFIKMGYADKLKFKSEFPEVYKEFIK